MRLYKKLMKYTSKKIMPMHMPGHKRKNYLKNKLPYKLDITEIENFDNLHNATGILKDCQENASNLYNTKATYFLVNGSTCGILSAIKSVCNIKDEVLVSKNCHKSVFNAIELLNLKCSFIHSHFDKKYGIYKNVYPQDIDNCLQNNKQIKCVIITSPTYEGIISNIKQIAKIVHKHNKILIVDEAHGAHLFLENKSACVQDADIVINSLHKTLPSLTQTALLHICSNRVNIDKIKHNLTIFQSSSPSYILLSSIDECIHFLKNKGKKFYNKLKTNLDFFYLKAKNLVNLNVVDFINTKTIYDFDRTKIIVSTVNTNINGQKLLQLLRKNNIEFEMSYSNYALAISTIFDKKKDFKKLLKILFKIDKSLTKKQNKFQIQNINLESSITICAAQNKKSTNIELDKSVNKIACEYVYVYPPGIPLIIPGQKINKEIINYIKYLKNNDLNLLFSSNHPSNLIKVCEKY